MHIKAITYKVQCPVYPTMCSLLDRLDTVGIRDHLAGVYSIVTKEKSKRKRKVELLEQDGGSDVEAVKEDQDLVAAV